MEQLKELINVLCDQAEEYADTVMPGYTHLQRAQPITFGHHLMAYAEMFLRDIGRMQDALKLWTFARSAPALWPERRTRSTVI